MKLWKRNAIAAAIAALFTWVYPWVQSYLELGQSSVGGA